MKEYQNALKFASEQKYDDALGALNDTIQNVEDIIGQNTNFHLFLYQRIASIQIIKRDILAVEDTFKKCIDCAESSKVSLDPKLDQTQNVFMW